LIQFDPHKKQYDFLNYIFNDRKKVTAYIGGIRGGKTYIGARAAALKVLECPEPRLGWIVSPTYPMSAVPEREFESTGIMEFCTSKNKNDRSYTFNTPNGEFRVEIKTADKPDHLRGPGLAFIWIDEAAYIDEECFDVLQGRVLDTKGDIFITTTPKRNWLYDRVYLESMSDKSYACVKSKTEENPKLDPADIAKLRKRYSDDFARQELDAEFVSFEGMVYKAFDPKVHIIQPIPVPANAQIYGGIDFGFNDPFVHLWIGYWDNRYFILDEHYEPGQSFSYHAHKILMQPFDKQVITRFADPSNPQGMNELGRYGVYSVPGKRDILSGVQRISKLLESKRPDGWPALLIFENCEKTINELGRYCYGDNNRETPKSGFDHCMDALRYVISSIYVDEDPVGVKLSRIPEDISPSERRIIEDTMSIPMNRRSIKSPEFKRYVKETEEWY